MAKREKRPKVVEITWLDSCSNHGWYKGDELHDAGLMEMKTVGYLVRRTGRDIAVAQARAESGKWSEVWVIPAKSVKHMRRIR